MTGSKASTTPSVDLGWVFAGLVLGGLVALGGLCLELILGASLSSLVGRPTVWISVALPLGSAVAAGLLGAARRRGALLSAAVARGEQARDDEQLDVAPFRKVFEVVHDGVVLLDATGRIRALNPAAEAMFGMETQALAGRWMYELVPDLRTSRVSGSFERRTSSGTALGTAWLLKGRRADGSIFPAELTFNEVRIGDERRYVYIIRDAGQGGGPVEIKPVAAAGWENNATPMGVDELAAAQAKARAKETYLDSLSHELRTPLNAIVGYTEMLLEDAEDKGLDGFLPDLERIRRSGRHLVDLVNTVLELSQIEAGRMSVHIEQIPVRPVVETVTDAVRPLAEERHNALIVQIAAKLDTAWLDRTKLEQMLINLVAYACRSTNNGTVALDVRLHEGEGGRWLHFVVADNGEGMSESRVRRLFSGAARGEVEADFAYGGSALGLTISKRFAELLGGDIDVDSAPGAGTTFTLRLPDGAPPRV